MAGVWPWMERRRLACGDHLGELVEEVGDRTPEGGIGTSVACALSSEQGSKTVWTGWGHTGVEHKAQMEAGRAECLAGRRTGFHPPLDAETLALVPGRGRGSQEPAASSGGEGA